MRDGEFRHWLEQQIRELASVESDEPEFDNGKMMAYMIVLTKFFKG